jgi:AbrB family looped-hinge helix DNA binding protein
MSNWRVESGEWRMEMETEIIKVRKKYQITLPAAVREAAGVYEGDFLTAQVQEDGSILLRPAELVEADEAFFYTPEWQAAEQEADEDLATGRYDDFETMVDLIADLESAEDESSNSEA